MGVPKIQTMEVGVPLLLGGHINCSSKALTNRTCVHSGDFLGNIKIRV